MNSILIIAEKRKQINPYIEAVKNRGFNAEYLRVSKITLVSKSGKTLIKSLGEEIEIPESVFIQTRTSLAPFIEPLLEELIALNTYTSAKKGSYYIGWNEPFMFITLALASVPAPKTITTASAKNLEKISQKISYPVIVKTFLGKKAQQSLIIHTNSELKSFVRSIKTEIDAFMIREFIEGDVITNIVIGKKVISVKRKYNEENVAEIRDGQLYKLADHDTETAISAAKACGYDIARVDLVKGRVVKVEPFVPLEEFNAASADNIEEYAADFLIEKAKQYEKETKIQNDFLGLRKLLSKTPLRGLVK